MIVRIIISGLTLCFLLAIIWQLSPSYGHLGYQNQLIQLKELVNEQLTKHQLKIKSHQNNNMQLSILNNEITSRISASSAKDQKSQQIEEYLQQLKSSTIHLQTIHIVTIIIPYHVNYTSTVNHIQSEINPIMNKFAINNQQLVILFDTFQQSIYQQNIVSKFNDTSYLQSIVNELLQSRYMKQCRYTWKQCQNYLIYSMNMQQNDEYYSSEGVYILPSINATMIKQVILDLMDILPIIHLSQDTKDVKRGWYQIQYIKLIQQTIKEINYLNYTSINYRRYHYSNNQLARVQKWIREVYGLIDNYNNYQYGQLWCTQNVRILMEENIGGMNLFPSDYKIGVYMPLLVVAIYPLIALFKFVLFYIKPKQNKQ